MRKKENQYPNLSSEMSRFNIAPEDIATVIGKIVSNVRAKLRGDYAFSLDESCKIRDYFNEKYGTAFTIDYLFSTEPIVV